ncbi:MAG: hypothetical protein RLZZ591_1928 [Pseudomonadota bacterium]|jgi:outer membrane murein-binding lipoprotein Lpp
MDIMGICNHHIDGLVSKIRSMMTTGLFEKIEEGVVNLAKVSTPVAAIAGALIAFVIAIKGDSLAMFFGGFMWIVFVVLMYYTGCKLQKTCQNTINSNPFSIASQELLDVAIVVYALLAVFAIFSGIYISIKISEIDPMLYGLSGGGVMIYVVWILLNPNLVTTSVEPSSSAGMDAIAVFSLGNKIFLRTNKLLFGILPTLAALLLLNSLIEAFGDPFQIMDGGIKGAIGFVLLTVGLLSPLLAYTIFLVGYMFLDVMRAILVMGAKEGAVTRIAPVQVEASPHSVRESVPSFDWNPGIVKKIVIGVLVLIIGAVVYIKGNEFYTDYKLRADIERAADERKQAQEAARLAQEEAMRAKESAEKDRINAFVANAREFVGKPAIDLVLSKEINKKFRDIFRDKLSDFENYFSDSGQVVEGDGLIVGQGCIKSLCDSNKALAVVDLKTASVYTVVVMGNSVRYFGIIEDNLPADIKKWVLANKP